MVHQELFRINSQLINQQSLYLLVLDNIDNAIFVNACFDHIIVSDAILCYVSLVVA